MSISQDAPLPAHAGLRTLSASRTALSVVAALSLTTAGCVTDPNTGHRHVSRTAIGIGVGVASGILLGGVIGGAGGRIIGAGIGGVVGGSIGYTMDKQFKELKEKTEGTGVAITKVDDNKAILVSLPDGVVLAAAPHTGVQPYLVAASIYPPISFLVPVKRRAISSPVTSLCRR